MYCTIAIVYVHIDVSSQLYRVYFSIIDQSTFQEKLFTASKVWVRSFIIILHVQVYIYILSLYIDYTHTLVYSQCIVRVCV